MKLSKQQIKDSALCDKMSMSGEDMECIDCSCSVCIAQEIQEDDLEPGLKKAIEIIDKELEFARGVNPVMAMGMMQVRGLIEKALK